MSAGLSAVSAVSAENVRKASAATQGSSAAMLTASAAARGRHLQTKAQQGRPNRYYRQASAFYLSPLCTEGRASAFVNASELACDQGTVGKLEPQAFQRYLGRRATLAR